MKVPANSKEELIVSTAKLLYKTWNHAISAKMVTTYLGGQIRIETVNKWLQEHKETFAMIRRGNGEKFYLVREGI